MTRWTEEQYDDYIKSLVPVVDPGPDVADNGPEYRLQSKCIKYCKDRGYPVFHDYSRRRNEAGWPDLFIFLSGGRKELIELKAGKKGLREEQRELKRHLMYLGHEVHVVRSFKKFLEVVEKRGMDSIEETGKGD